MKKTAWLFFLFVPFFMFAKEKICLNMIVKNENHVINRCLDSVKHLIDYWVIIDTGSTDGTQKSIKNILKNIPGELHQRPWKNFSHNRNEALDLARNKADYILFMDADDILEYDEEFKMPALKADLYNMWRGSKAFSYTKPQIARCKMPWKWVGVTHEYLDCDNYYTSEILDGVRYTTLDDGATRKNSYEKFMRNVHLLEEGLKEEPENSRYAFYLAESYWDAGEKGKALQWYQNRINRGGWDEEIFWSLLRIAHGLKILGFAENLIVDSYRNAHHFRPHRLEPIYYLAEYYNQKQNYKQAYEWLKRRDSLIIPATKDALFNEDWIDEYGLNFQLSICAYHLGYYQESFHACQLVLKTKNLPEFWRQQAEKNMQFALTKLPSKNVSNLDLVSFNQLAP